MKKITPKSIRMALAAAIPIIAVLLCICIMTVRRQRNSPPAQLQTSSSAQAFHTDSADSSGTSSRIAAAELQPLAAVTYPETSSYPQPLNQEKTSSIFQSGYKRFAAKSASLLLKESEAGKNSFYSPVSLFMAAAMLTECTAGETQKELLAMLEMSEATQLRNEMPVFFRSNYFSNDVGSMKPANAVWVQKDAGIKSSLVSLLAKDYYAESFAAAFGTPETVGQIGGWLKQHTGGKFDTAPSAAEDPLTVLMLINAVAFHNEWQDQFYEEKNEKGDFTLADKKTVPAEFMRRDAKMQAAVKANCTLVDLPMKNNCTMRLVLPAAASPAALYDRAEALSAALESGTSEYLVHLKLPKFRYQADMDLKKSMQAMGVTRVFDDKNADFSPMTDRRDIYLSEAIQKSCVSVDEKGCEAAAYTSFSLAGKGMPQSEKQPPEITVTLDRPFLFSISREGVPLFVGVVQSPVGKADT